MDFVGVFFNHINRNDRGAVMNFLGAVDGLVVVTCFLVIAG